MWDKRRSTDGRKSLSDLVHEEKKKETLVRLNVEIPESLHYQLKMYALQNKQKVREVVIESLSDHLVK